MTSYIKYSMIAAVGISVLSLTACNRDDDDPEDPELHADAELITTVELELEDLETNTFATYRWADPDGPGGNDPTIDAIDLINDHQYNAELRFLDESGAEVEDITTEIVEEDDEHFVCFDGVVGLSIQYTDTDGTYVIGLKSLWSALATASGTLTITLKHQPGVKDGTCDPGETDVEVDFPIEITE